MVLTALSMEDPELTNLYGRVHNGGDATTVYPAIVEMNPAEATTTRHKLLDY